MQQTRHHTYGGGVSVPAGLILGLKAGSIAPDGWSVFVDADGYYLKGTNSNTLVGTVAARTALSYSSGSGGSHSGGSGGWAFSFGGTVTGEIGNTPSRDESSYGNHTHSITVTYNPPAAELKLLLAGAGARFDDTGVLIGFATAELPSQLPYSLFDSGGYLRANTVTQNRAESKSLVVGSGLLPAHDHHNSDWHKPDSLATGATSVGSSSSTHNHGGSATPTITSALAQTLLRAYALIDNSDITGLIGLWATSDPIPDGWELVTALTDRFAKFSAAGDGAQSGGNTINISASTSSSGHSHGYSGSSYGESAVIHHSNSVTHSHSLNKSGMSYQPARYHVKFIRYVG